MKNIKKLLSFLIGMLFLYSCSTTEPEPKNDYLTFKIKVDKLTHPDTVSANDSLTIMFDGTVGNDGCHSFSHFEGNKNSHKIEITVWGSKPSFDTACLAVMVSLNKKEYKLLPKQKGIYRIIVHQPDNSLLIDSVFVK